MPPKGRTTKAAPKTAKDESKDVPGVCAGKYNLPMVTAK
jgi:hypothetical protein